MTTVELIDFIHALNDWLQLQLDLAVAFDENDAEAHDDMSDLRALIQKFGLPVFDERTQAFINGVMPIYAERHRIVGYRRGRLEILQELSAFIQASRPEPTG